MPGQIWTMWFGERSLCALVLSAAPVPSSPQEENQECGPEGNQCILRMVHQETRIPVCISHAERPRAFPTHTVYGDRTTF